MFRNQTTCSFIITSAKHGLIVTVPTKRGSNRPMGQHPPLKSKFRRQWQFQNRRKRPKWGNTHNESTVTPHFGRFHLFLNCHLRLSLDLQPETLMIQGIIGGNEKAFVYCVFSMAFGVQMFSFSSPSWWCM